MRLYAGTKVFINKNEGIVLENAPKYSRRAIVYFKGDDNQIGIVLSLRIKDLSWDGKK